VKRPLRFDPTGLRAAIAFAILAALANAVWIFLDHSNPSWDQAHFLTVTLEYRHALSNEGIGGFFHALNVTDPSRGPLFSVAMLPFFYAFGSGARSGMLLNVLLAPVLYIAAGQIAWLVFRSWLVRILTILLVATMPLTVSLYHTTLQDFLLVTLATVAVLLLLLSDRFCHRWASLGLGLAMGLGTLTKVTFPAFVIGPLLIAVAQIVVPQLRGGEEVVQRPELRRRLANILGAAFVYLLVALPWYLPHFSETLDYIRSTTSGPLSEGAGPSNPLTIHAITAFTANMVNAHVSWIIGLAGLTAMVLRLPRFLPLLRALGHDRRLSGLAILFAWILVPYLSIVTAHNQDIRLMAPAMPAIAILIAGAMSAVRQRRARMALIGVTATLLVYTTLVRVVSIAPDFLPNDPGVHLDSYDAAIPLDSRPIGYEQLPGSDYATPVMEYLEQLARQQPPTSLQRLCMLESEPVMNGNTIGFFSKARGDEFEVTDVVTGPDGLAGLRRSLSECDFALYVKPPRSTGDETTGRIVVANEDYASHYMTPSLLALFHGPNRTFPLAAGESLEGEEKYLSTTGRSDRVRVLSRHAD
jgi:4-amino-4-deoxy-L-arabinose transferase-like glycosyltransferase